MAHDGQATASVRTVRREGRNDQGAALTEAQSKALNVCGPIGLVGEEMKHGPIVPDIDLWDRPSAGHVRFNPRNSVLGRAQPDLCPGERRTRNIEHRHALIPSRQEDVREAGIPAPNVDHSTRRLESCCVDQLQRYGRLWLKPAQFSRLFGPKHMFPVLFAFHCPSDLRTIDHGGDGRVAPRTGYLQPV